MLSLKVAGIGVYLPDRKETRDDFINRGISNEQIEYMGVYEKRIMAAGQTVSDMEVEASQMAIREAGLKPDDIDLIICAPLIPKMIVAANSNRLQHLLGATNAAAFDIYQTCSVITPAMVTAANFLTSGQYKRILLTASTYWTAIEDHADTKSGFALSDGAAAVVLTASGPGYGILSYDMKTDGRYFYSCGSRIGRSHEFKYHENHDDKLLFYIDEADVFGSTFGQAIRRSGPERFHAALGKAGLSPDDIDCGVIQGIAKPQVASWIAGMNMPEEKFPLTYSRFGHLSVAVILANLKEGLEKGMIKKDSLVAFVSVGAGISSGCIIMRWS